MWMLTQLLVTPFHLKSPQIWEHTCQKQFLRPDMNASGRILRTTYVWEWRWGRATYHTRRHKLGDCQQWHKVTSGWYFHPGPFLAVTQLWRPGVCMLSPCSTLLNTVLSKTRPDAFITGLQSWFRCVRSHIGGLQTHQQLGQHSHFAHGPFSCGGGRWQGRHVQTNLCDQIWTRLVQSYSEMGLNM